MDGFLGIGFWEILLIFVIILALLGPRKLPEIAARLGTLMRQLKRASFDLTSQLAREVEGTGSSKDDSPLDSLRKAASDLKSSVLGDGGQSVAPEEDVEGWETLTAGGEDIGEESREVAEGAERLGSEVERG